MPCELALEPAVSLPRSQVGVMNEGRAIVRARRAVADETPGVQSCALDPRRPELGFDGLVLGAAGARQRLKCSWIALPLRNVRLRAAGLMRLQLRIQASADVVAGAPVFSTKTPTNDPVGTARVGRRRSHWARRCFGSLDLVVLPRVRTLVVFQVFAVFTRAHENGAVEIQDHDQHNWNEGAQRHVLLALLFLAGAAIPQRLPVARQGHGAVHLLSRQTRVRVPTEAPLEAEDEYQEGREDHSRAATAGHGEWGRGTAAVEV